MKIIATTAKAFCLLAGIALALSAGCRSDSGGHGPMRVCLDLDRDGYSQWYRQPPPSAERPLLLNDAPCQRFQDVDDADPLVWFSGSPPAITSVPSDSVIGGELYLYNVVCADADIAPNLVLAVGPLDSCGGAMADNGDGTGTYTFDSGLLVAGSECVAVVACTDLQPDLQDIFVQAAVVTIIIPNFPPYFTSAPPDASLDEGEAYAYVPTFADDDLPNAAPGDPGFVTCAVAANTCGGWLIFAGCDAAGAPAEADAPGACSYTLRLTDGMAATADQVVSLTLNEVNQAPYFTDAGPAAAAEGTLYTYDAGFADDDLPPDVLTCAVTANTCSWLGATNCSVSGAPEETHGGSNCSYTLTVDDGLAATDQVVNVAVAEVNQAPVITNLPQTQSGHWGQPNSYDVDASDPLDQPPNALTFDLVPFSTCSFGFGLYLLTGVVVWTCGGVENCTVDIEVYDNGVPSLSDVETLTIQCTNQAPQLTINPPDGTESIAYTYNVTCTDPDGDSPLDLDTTGANSCGGSITVDNGDGTGTYGWTPAETQGGNTCTVGISCTDTQDTVSAAASISIIEDNKTPVWSTLPSNPCVAANIAINQDNGAATDADIPNTAGTNGFIGCSLDSTNCSFGITVSDVGTGQGSVACHLAFTTPVTGEQCSATLKVEDDGLQSVTQAITITVIPAVLHADTAGSDPGGPGFTWANAFKHPQSAIDFAFSCNVSNVQVWVRTGTYYRPSGSGNGPVIQMRNNFGIYGGFAGTETALAQRNKINANATILDGQDLSYHVINAATSNVVDGFIVQNGNAPSGAGVNDQYGAGLNNYHQTNITVENCIFRDNFAQMGGAAIANSQGVMDIFNCAFYNNMVYGPGGAIDNESNISYITNCTFTGNQGGLGGALAYLNVPSGSTLTSSILWGNTAASNRDIYVQGGWSPSVSASDVQQSGGADPLFAAGTYGNYYLTQATSPCVNTGAGTAAAAGLNTFTTSPANVADSGTVDMGFHYTIP